MGTNGRLTPANWGRIMPVHNPLNEGGPWNYRDTEVVMVEFATDADAVLDILEREGKVFEAHSYPGEPHGFRNPMNRVDMYRRLEAWFDRWLRDSGDRP